jgi:site-specific DNA-methyltransferase (adenine-specific)
MHLADCVDVLPKLEPVDVCIQDPPYEVEAHTKARRSLKDATQKRGARNTGEVRRIDRPLLINFTHMTSALRSDVSRLEARIVRRWTLTFCQVEAIGLWRQAFEEAGLQWIRAGVWIKPNGMPQMTGDRPGQGFESLAIVHPKGRKRWNGGGKHAVWTVPLDHNAGGGGKNEHPTSKPVALMLQLVSDFSQHGEAILDPFAGSGTTGVACLRLGRRFIGVERDERYFELACERLRAEEAGSTVQAARARQHALFDVLATRHGGG